MELSSQAALNVQHPINATGFGPGAVLDRLHQYFSEVVIPTLVTGGPATPALPRQMRLADNGASLEQRIREGKAVGAHERLAAEADRAYLDNRGAPPTPVRRRK